MIKNIRVKNYKSLRDVSVDLEPITVLVGRGGTGKSNFISAIAYLRNWLAIGNRSAALDAGLLCEFASPFEQVTKGLGIEFSVCFEVPGQSGDFAYRLYINAKNTAHSSESLTHGQEIVFRRDQGKWVKEPEMVPLPAPTPISLQLASGIREVGLAYTILTAGIGCYDFGGDVFQGARQQRQSPDAGLSDDAANFLACYEGINRNLQNVAAQQEIIAALRRLKPSLRNLGIQVPGRDRVNVSLKSEKKDYVFDLAQESEGFRRFFAHLLALYQVPPKSLVTFEEPEKGMYPGALAALAEQIKAFPQASGGQVILTTHNPLLLNHFKPEQIRVVEMEDLETRIGPVSESQLEALHEQLESTGDLLTVDPAQLAS